MCKVCRPYGGYREGGISKIFRRGHIEGGIYFDDEIRKKPEKPKTVFFGLNLTKLTLI